MTVLAFTPPAVSPDLLRGCVGAPLLAMVNPQQLSTSVVVFMQTYQAALTSTYLRYGLAFRWFAELSIL